MAAILCTALGGDHNKDAFAVLSGYTEFVNYPPRNHVVQIFAYLYLWVFLYIYSLHFTVLYKNFRKTNFAAHFVSIYLSRLLDPEDVDVDRPDEKSVMTYVAQFLHRYPEGSEGKVGACLYSNDAT